MSLPPNEILLASTDAVRSAQDLKRIIETRLRSSEYYINCSTTTGRIKAYQKCDVLRTVISKSSSAIANLKVWALDEDGREIKTRQSQRIIQKLKRPNPKEDFKRWFKKLDVQCKLHGKAYVHKMYSSAFDEWNYYIIPFQFVQEQYKTETDLLFERVVDKYIINDGTSSYFLYPEQVHVFYDVSLSTSPTDYSIFGGSRLESLSDVITTYTVIWEVLSEMYANRGALNIISMGVNNPQMAAMPNVSSEKESILKRLAERFGLRRGQDKNVVITTDAKVHPLTAKMSDMMFEKMIVECKKAIGAAYDIPAPLLDIESSRYKNMTESIKNLYTNASIPTAEYFFSEWLQMINEFDLNFELKADYSHLEFYQQAKKEEAVAFQQMASAVSTLAGVAIDGSPVITNSEARLKLDLE